MNRINYLINRHKSERVSIIANGPSLNQMDLSFLKKETTIGLNKIYLGIKKFGFYPRYYVAVNEKVIQQSQEHIKHLNCVKFISNRGSQWIQEDALTYHINTTEPLHRFCKDITQGVHEGWTVTYSALQIAYYLGFKEVIIIGLDHNYIYTGKPNEETILQGEDPNHFCGEYFGHGQKWDNPDLERSEDSYRIAREVFEQDGRRIIDATVGGHCSVFEKADYKKIFNIA